MLSVPNLDARNGEKLLRLGPRFGQSLLPLQHIHHDQDHAKDFYHDYQDNKCQYPPFKERTIRILIMMKFVKEGTKCNEINFGGVTKQRNGYIKMLTSK